MRFFIILITLGSVIALGATAHAEDYPTYAGRKLSRGLTNTAFGWADILKSQEKVANQEGPIVGAVWGTLDGVGNAVKRTAAGVYETATFPIKTSENADPLIQPEYIPIGSDRAGDRPKEYTF